MVYPEGNTGIAGLSFDESDLLQNSTDLHAKILRETSLKYGKTTTYLPVNLIVMVHMIYQFLLWTRNGMV